MRTSTQKQWLTIDTARTIYRRGEAMEIWHRWMTTKAEQSRAKDAPQIKKIIQKFSKEYKSRILQRRAVNEESNENQNSKPQFRS